MVDALHTPGPWTVVPYGDGDSLVICSDEGGEWRICFMATHGGTETVWRSIQANARLIAAAPELLAALIAARNTLAGCGMPSIAAGICDAAIAKATATPSTGEA